MTQRWKALPFLLLSVWFAAHWAWSLQKTMPGGMVDMKAVYYASRCALEHKNPYDPTALAKVYQDSADPLPSDPKMRGAVHNAIALCVNLPTALLLMTPWAMIPWGMAHGIWFALESIGLLAAAWMVLDLAGGPKLNLALALACLLVSNCEVFLATGNLATVVMAASVAAVWCFETGRYEWLGILLLAVALVLKPHDSGFVWLFLLLRGSAIRKSAVKVLFLCLALFLISVIWIAGRAPDWPHELQSNLGRTTVRGEINDPGPHSMVSKGAGMIVSLQSVASYIRDDPGFYNSATLLICGSLLLMWLIGTVRLRDMQNPTLALAVIIPLSLLITYHRNYDAKVLLLTIPACVQLWSEGGLRGKLAAAVNLVVFTLSGDITVTAIFKLESNVHFVASGRGGRLLTLLLDRPIALGLLLMAVFYLVIYLRRVGVRVRSCSAGPEPEPAV